MEEKIYLAGLHVAGFSQKKLGEIFQNKENYREVFKNISRITLKKYCFGEKQIDTILERHKKVDFSKLKLLLKKRNAKIVTFHDVSYPDFLKEIPNSPFVFYLRGKIDNTPKISVVGSRKITEYGKSVISQIIPQLARSFTIVSGGAAGCDTEAHKYTLKGNNQTISILGTGIDIDYPVSNKKLYDEIVEKKGGVLSIFPLGEVGNPYNFPMRNEIVAGLSLGTLVVEAQKKSGTLITAQLSLDLGKDLFAIPGDICKKSSEGCNNLIQKGMAKLVLTPQDILEEYNISLQNNLKEEKNKDFSCSIEKELYEILYGGALTIDEMIKRTSYDLKTITMKLSLLEISGFIKKGLGGKYSICS